ncbi:MAG TPA: SWIM zinc finger family protein [Saprospiraceae bacterium]|nr:SWIM zinc finger family protein [Saprospiraceae bacterium]HMQ85148.1 SWIM zinc finger family protein [Saprospiraceae bacterium]
MFTLDNFENQVPDQIQKRGLDYFKTRAVGNISEINTGHWEAIVFGSEDYEVEIQLRGRQITHWDCNCPYDGSICKHVVAVLYTLRETKPEKSKEKNSKARKMSFEDVLLQLDLEELRAFIREQKAQHRDFGNQFLLYFADKDPTMDMEKKYREMVQQLVRKHSDRGFMDYRNTIAFYKAMRPILLAANQALTRNNFREALAVAKVVCLAGIDSIQHCDDSSGSIGDILFEGIHVLEKAAQSTAVAPELLDDIFTWLEKQLANSIWFDYGDFGYELLDVAASIAKHRDADRYIRLLDQLRMMNTGINYSSKFKQELFVKKKVHFLQAVGREQEIEQLIADNIDIVSIRRGQVEKAIEQRNYPLAKQLIEAGIQIAEGQKHPGTVHQWEEVLIRIAQLEQDIPTFRSLTKRFAFERGVSIKFYQSWKSSFSLEEWPDVIEQHIQATITEERSKPRHDWDDVESSLYTKLSPIYIEEQLWDKLLQVLPPYPTEYQLQPVHPYLAKRYPKEMLAFYLGLLEKMGDKASARNDYYNLAMLMKKVKQDIEHSHRPIDELATSLIQKYPRRPAMKEELGKVLMGR